MSTFEDSKGRSWNISLNIGSMKRIKERLGFDFLSTDAESNPILKLASDYLTLADVVWILVEDEAGKRGVTVDDFVESLVGDPLDKLVDAMAVAYTDFTPNPKRRETLMRLWQKVRQAEELALSQASAKIVKDPQMDGR